MQLMNKLREIMSRPNPELGIKDEDYFIEGVFIGERPEDNTDRMTAYLIKRMHYEKNRGETA
jgi:hypothetical protein